MSQPVSPESLEHTMSVVVPVYGGSTSLPILVAELESFTRHILSPGGISFRVAEVILVNDCGLDGSEHVIRELANRYPWVQAVWLSRNYGQHAATLAGMAASSSEWIVTMDEDGQQNPNDIGKLLDTALQNHSQLVYARPSNKPPHGKLRNGFSIFAKKIFAKVLTDGSVPYFNSYRLVLGEIGRTLAAYVGNEVYLDVALTWVVQEVSTCSVELRCEIRPHSGYNFRQLSSHFWRLVLNSGTRPLRIVSITGIVALFVGVIMAIGVAVGKLAYDYPATGWASVFVLLLLVGGMTMLVLGILAEYLGIVVRSSIGKPLYVVVGDPAKSAHQRNQPTAIDE